MLLHTTMLLLLAAGVARGSEWWWGPARRPPLWNLAEPRAGATRCLCTAWRAASNLWWLWSRRLSPPPLPHLPCRPAAPRALRADDSLSGAIAADAARRLPVRRPMLLRKKAASTFSVALRRMRLLHRAFPELRTPYASGPQVERDVAADPPPQPAVDAAKVVPLPKVQASAAACTPQAVWLA